MSQNTQLTIGGGQITNNVEFEADARILRPFKNLISQFVNEYKIHFTENSVDVSAVDPANVAMFDNVSLDVDAFETYDLIGGEFTAGLSSKAFGSALRHARYGKSNSDIVQVAVDDRYMTTVTRRDFGGHEAELKEQVACIDPDSIRDEPDIPDMDLSGRAEIGPGALCRVLKTLEGEHARFKIRDEGLYVIDERDTDTTEIFVDCPAFGEAESLYSEDYLSDVHTMLKDGLVDDTTIHMGDEFPIIIEFEREGVYSGDICVAPRIQSE